MDEMAEKKQERGASFPVPDWWLNAVARARGELKNDEIAVMLLNATGRRYDNTQVSKCLNKDPDKRVTPMHLVDGLSDLFEIPRPFYIAINEDEALRFRTQRKRTVLLGKLPANPQVTQDRSTFDQSRPIQSAHGEEEPEGGGPGRVGGGRRKAQGR